MLTLKDLTKEYILPGRTVKALCGVSINFREREFVAVLGPSGCGKTTLLNIIGGLDRATGGELIIDGRSTKRYSSRDFDAYRNRRVGFVFQNYNLIPHQTALENVELGLAIAGMKKQERREKALSALRRVGLEADADKLPGQLSGGQQQRVAIARAVVNDPDILLADEPTGALDSKTGVSVMELLKEISKDRLVVTVTHNAELAERFATRTMRLSDGAIVEDTAPYFPESSDAKAEDRLRCPKMSLATSIRLSARNLLAKLKRTVLVVLAGSIGIIGVSSVLAVSTGVRDYIDSFQDDMLSGNPVEVSKSGVDVTSAVNNASLSVKAKAVEYGDWVNVNSIVEYLINNENALDSLFYTNEFDKDYINYVESMPDSYRRAVLLDYGIEESVSIYTDFRVSDAPVPGLEKYDRGISVAAITETYAAVLERSGLADYSQYVTGLATGFREGIADREYILEQYELLAGTLPERATDLLIVLNDDEQMNDVLLAQLGYYSAGEFYKIVSGGDYKSRFTYDEIMSKRFTWYPNDAIYKDLSFKLGGETVQRYEYLFREADIEGEGVELRVCGIVKPKSSLSYGALKLGVVYTEELARYMISRNAGSAIAENVRKYGAIQSCELKNELKQLYGSDTLGISCRLDYIYSDDGGNTFAEAAGDEARTFFVGRTKSGTRNTVLAFLSAGGISVGSGTESMIDAIANSRTMDLNGVAGTYLPESLKIYPASFAAKALVTDYLDEWNGEGEVNFYDYKDDLSDMGAGAAVKTLSASERSTVKASDETGVIIGMINNVTDAVTYALVAFTALSLVVSTVMIGILTYVSVLERVKEIGVIRSLGGRKRDVSRLFVAEATIIGLAGGVFGVLITLLLTLFGNAVAANISGGTIPAIARLTLQNALVMVAVSVLLTLVSGLLPARAAAKKDPAAALRAD